MFRSTSCLMVLVVLVGVGEVKAQPILGPTGNYYEFVDQVVSWEEARNDAASRAYMGLTGHLVTITSQEEEDFIWNSLTQDVAYGGAADAETEGTWKWVVGPEAGTVFWKDGSTLTYANWRFAEPNNDSGIEHYLMVNYAGKHWNDERGVGPYGYIVEYSVPEPSSLFLMATAALGLLACGWRKR